MNLGTILKSVSNSLGFKTAHENQIREHAKPPTLSSVHQSDYSSSSRSGSDTTTSSCRSPVSPRRGSTSSTLSLFSNLLTTSDEEEQETASDNRLAAASARLSKGQHPYKQIIEHILRQVGELEHTLYEDQQQEFKLRMALDRQTERAQELSYSLDAEKKRNGRLVQLLHGVDSASSSESDPEELNFKASVGDIYGSISPLLMQQRYDELTASHRQSRRQLAKKDKALKLLKCEKEQLNSKYEQLFDEYRCEQRRFEIMCTQYLQMQIRKKQQIFALKNTLSYAAECIYYARVALKECCPKPANRTPIVQDHIRKFKKNLEFFMNALRNCCCLKKVEELQQQQQQAQQQQQPQDNAATKKSKKENGNGNGKD
ncbi:hypothetical protein KR018_002784, partial [Drosophila ironensis]